MSKEEILEEWLRQTDQTYINKGHKMVILNAMEEYAKQQVSKLPIHGVSGCLPTKEEVVIEGDKQIKEWLSDNSFEERTAYRIGFRRSYEYVLRLINNR